VAVHVVGVVAGTVGLAVTVGYLGAVRGGGAAAGVRRFFTGGPGQAPRLLYPAAAFGLVAALSSSDRIRLEWAWVWVAGVLWLLAAVCIEAGMRPAERRVGVLLDAGDGAGAAARSGLAAGSAALVLVLTASALMVAQP
jgi:hypothetical protein